jgi:hypothetical protein
MSFAAAASDVGRHKEAPMMRALCSSTLLLCLVAAGCALDQNGNPIDLPAEEELGSGGSAGAAAAAQPGEAAVKGDGPITPAAVCGDQICAPNVEDCGNCPGDCPCWQQGTFCSGGQCVGHCGDNFCAPNLENCGNCPIDCACPGGTVCQNNQCREPCDFCCRKPWLCEPQ